VALLLDHVTEPPEVGDSGRMIAAGRRDVSKGELDPVDLGSAS
jgi:hypothetical protein